MKYATKNCKNNKNIRYNSNKNYSELQVKKCVQLLKELWPKTYYQ